MSKALSFVKRKNVAPHEMPLRSQLVNRFIWLEVNLLVKFIKHNQNYYLKHDVSTSFRGLHQKKPVLSSSDS